MSMPIIETVITIDELAPTAAATDIRYRKNSTVDTSLYMHSMGQCGLVGTEHGLLS